MRRLIPITKQANNPNQRINPLRQAKRFDMKRLGIKSGKAYRHYLKLQRLIERERQK